MRHLPSHLPGTLCHVHAGLLSTLDLSSATASRKDTGPFGSRCSKSSRFRCWIQCRRSHVSRKQLVQRVFRRRERLGRVSGSESHRSPVAAQSLAGRGPRRPCGSRPSRAGCGSKSHGRPSLRSDPICTRPAGRLGPPTSGLECPIFLPSRCWRGEAGWGWGEGGGGWALVLSLVTEMWEDPAR